MPKRLLAVLLLPLVVGGCSVGGRPRAATTTTAPPTTPQVGQFGSFELNTNGWTGLGFAVILRTLALHRLGRAAARVGPPKTAPYPAPYGAYAPNVVANPSYRAKYRLSLWIRPNVQAEGATVTVYLSEVGGKAPGANTAERTVTLRRGWQFVALAGRVRARKRAFLSISIRQMANIFPSDAFYIDGVKLQLAG